MWRGALSYRRLWVLLRYLPMESWTQTALRDSPLRELAAETDPKFGPWALENYQLASVLDAVRHLEVSLGRVHQQDWKYPEPTPRPGVAVAVPAEADRRQSDAAVLYLSKLRARG